jgi:1-deoxy-D-xylulose-5-phosphate reductoisomerase
MTRRNIAILGSTGSIGRSTLEVVSRFPDRFRVTSLTANASAALLREQIARFRPHTAVLVDEEGARALRGTADGSTEILSGAAALEEVVSRPDVDVVVSALVGFAGLRPTLRAIEAGKDVALANKETLVVAGELVMERVRRKGVTLLPVDSEHSAILQCLRGEDPAQVTRLYLTASGGPFLRLPPEHFASITVEEALAHPTWKMGSKITIDSATMMNKGLEVIEAHWLFGVHASSIEVVVHPQSVIHSMVEFADGSIKAQLGVPDMKIPIQYALCYPERPAADHARMDFARLGSMTFLEPDTDRFPCLGLAYRALELGGTAPAVLNAANEVAVRLFLEGRIPFPAIHELIGEALGAHRVRRDAGLDDLIALDAETRRSAERSSVRTLSSH